MVYLSSLSLSLHRERKRERGGVWCVVVVSVCLSVLCVVCQIAADKWDSSYEN